MLSAKTVNGDRIVSSIVRRTVLVCVRQAVAHVIRVLRERGVALVMQSVSVIIVNIAISIQDNARNAGPGIGAQTVKTNAKHQTALNAISALEPVKVATRGTGELVVKTLAI